MRDILITALVLGTLPFILKYPAVGAYVWAWLSMMNPHKLAYGFANEMPFAQIVAVTTLTAFVFARKRHPLAPGAILVFYGLLLLWMTMTSFFAIAPSERVLDRWIFVMKIHVMLYVTLRLVGEARQLQVLIWVVTLSVAFYGIKGGVWTVMTGGGGRVWGPPGGMVQGNNELAVALVMLMPFLYYLHHSLTQRWLRWALVLCMVSVAFSILGSQSRGALLAMIAMAFFLGLKGKYPVRTSLALVALGAIAFAFMPSTWTDRMETIRTYQEDTSAMSRIWTWKTLFAAAVDRPLVGAGFRADNAAVFARYAPTGPEWAVFEGSVYVAHSIYFQVLGEHGFVGLALFLLLGLATWWKASQLARQTTGDAEFGAWMPLLMRMVQVSLVGYAAGGAFLSLAYLDIPYYIVSYVVICDGLVRRRAAVTVPSATGHAAPDRSAIAASTPRIPAP